MVYDWSSIPQSRGIGDIVVYIIRFVYIGSCFTTPPTSVVVEQLVVVVVGSSKV